MTKILLSLIVLVAASLVNASALLPRASGNPSCFACPDADTAGFPLDAGSTSDNNGVLFCSYPAFEGEDPNDFYCTYNDQTGALITDNDAGFCPATASTANCAARRDDNFKAMKRRRAALPQSSGQQARSPLRKKRSD